jgi:hypothetical protein
MSNSELLTIITMQFGVLMAILGWAGVRIFNKLDDLATQNAGNMQAVVEGDKAIALEFKQALNEIHTRVTTLGERVSKVEATCHVMHQIKIPQ